LPGRHAATNSARPVTGTVARRVECLTLHTTVATALGPADGARSGTAVLVSPAAGFPPSAIRGRHRDLNYVRQSALLVQLAT
jgi:hypothetical protein